MEKLDKPGLFEQARPRLMGIAFRLLGSSAEAEDAVQDTAAKWLLANEETIRDPLGWMIRVCTNRCLDILGSARVSKTDYVGPWLPDQLVVDPEPDLSERLDRTASLTSAFLLLLERLTPKERAAYLLHDIFGMAFREIAETLQLSELHCRKLASRARKLVQSENVRFLPGEARQRELLDLFQVALQTGDLTGLAAALSADADFRADSGGKVTAVTEVVSGRHAVTDFISGTLLAAWSRLRAKPVRTNSGLGLLLLEPLAIHAIVTFGFDASGRISNIFVVRNPEKIDRFLMQSYRVTDQGELQRH
ncbi:sigma-70 family RNA polymerase sigma factor [Roseibium sp.]|uniref:sigma-70 family RNA polymerase sigma factor n=1 Tax=Roseibium sp. TaxID=1936156 RepID=UPI003BAE448C